MKELNNVKVFFDGADFDKILELNNDERISGFTTNPTIMKKSGVTTYKGFAQKVLEHVTEKPVSFEVFTDTLEEMEKEAYEINSWGNNVYVKIPITTTSGTSTIPLIKKLSMEKNIKINITAVFTYAQVSEIVEQLSNTETNVIISIFAGRISDSGVDPTDLMKYAHGLSEKNSNLLILWASTREVYNIFQADLCNTDIITCTGDIIEKLFKTGKDLDDLSIETIQMFADDAKALGFSVFE